jgi:hypothetical protein
LHSFAVYRRISPARNFSSRRGKFEGVTQFGKDGIALGKRLAKQYSANRDALGELANNIEKKYGDGTLEDFGEIIGIAYSTLNNCRHVYREWEHAPVKPKTFSLAKVLASYKDKDQYIKERPNSTEKEAGAHVRAVRKLARNEKEMAMLDSEKKDNKLGTWTKAAEKLIKDLQGILLVKWERKLDLLSQRRRGINLGTVADIIITLETSANMLLRYKTKFNPSAMIREYGTMLMLSQKRKSQKAQQRNQLKTCALCKYHSERAKVTKDDGPRSQRAQQMPFFVVTMTQVIEHEYGVEAFDEAGAITPAH